LDRSDLVVNQKFKKGVFALFSGQAIKVVVQIINLIVLARLLSPEDYGLTAVAIAIVGLCYNAFFKWLLDFYNFSGLFIYDDIRQLTNGISTHKKYVQNKNDILNSAQLLFGNDLVKKYWEKVIFKQ